MSNPLNIISSTLPWETFSLLGFYLLSAVYLIFSAILYFHWQQYSTNQSVSRVTAFIYLGTTLPLLIIMGISTSLI